MDDFNTLTQQKNFQIWLFCMLKLNFINVFQTFSNKPKTNFQIDISNSFKNFDTPHVKSIRSSIVAKHTMYSAAAFSDTRYQ